ncbi:dihydrodipicolinate reductase [Paracoccus alcaliphilus]|uniref:4-hydroxy-tetrahydrodipicolinate reductase n=1 Tax=Paracoccus alcaliphilus TaxID=34002 RepID=A0A1H8GMT6_9RHOB|nr:dihydrodipicolinate reductase [Paracoccus alcaliphilus]
MSDMAQTEIVDKPGIVVTGASGRMGQKLVRMLLQSDEARLVGVLERPGHGWLGRDIGEAMGLAPVGIMVSDQAVPVIAQAQAVIDFTTPMATLAYAELTAQARAVHVIGTTGFDEEDLQQLTASARHAPIIRAGNMSLGVNLLVSLTRKVAAALGEDWDIEIVESHHRHKVDAPSGTALMLGEAAAEGRGATLGELRTPARDGITGARPTGSIGFAAIRGGDIVGEHDVIFASQGERLILRHIANDRALFARGAIRAALWGQDKGPGEYDMADVLGLN